ncbi:MAG: hypothetical protein PVI40_08345 [Chlamydiota bacterium]|jgi:hypothetical protein
MTEFSREELYRFLHEMFTWINQLTERKKEISKEELHQFFLPNLKIYTNEDLPICGLDSFYKHIQISVEQYKHSYAKIPFKECLIEGNKAAVYYTIHAITERDEKYNFIAMSFFELENNKISKWFEIVTENASA